MHSKRSILNVSLFGIFLTIAFVNIALAASSPDQKLTKIVGELKASGTLAALIDYIDWDTAYSELPDFEKNALKVNSPAEYKAHQSRFFSDPGAFVEEQIKAQIQSAPPEQREVLAQNAEQIIKSTTAQTELQKSRMSQAVYRVGNADVSGQTASVELTVISVGGKDKQKVPMVLKGGEWYLTRFLSLNLSPPRPSGDGVEQVGVVAPPE